jgi:hypothetical protein
MATHCPQKNWAKLGDFLVKKMNLCQQKRLFHYFLTNFHPKK